MNFTDVIAQLDQANGTCNAAVTGITITIARQDLGIEFSYPYLSSGLGIMVRSSPASPSGWNWITPFSVWLWVAVILTIMLFPLFIFVIEFGSLKKRIHSSDVLPGVQEATFRSIWTVLGLETFQVSSLGARLASITFAFLALILVNT